MQLYIFGTSFFSRLITLQPFAISETLKMLSKLMAFTMIVFVCFFKSATSYHTLALQNQI